MSCFDYYYDTNTDVEFGTILVAVLSERDSCWSFVSSGCVFLVDSLLLLMNDKGKQDNKNPSMLQLD